MFASGKTAAVASAANYIEDVFSTYLYTGNGSTQTITNGIDLSTKGGLVWLKGRSLGYNNGLFDTIRGADYLLCSNNTDPSTSVSGVPANPWITGFNSNGFGLGSNGSANANTQTYASWTFRKQPKFFDVVTYTGDGTSPRSISHSLGSAPGCVIIKQTNAVNDWCVWHTATGNDKSAALNLTDAFATFAQRIKSVTSTTFTVGNSSTVNDSGATYVAYLFAHNAGGFGLTGTDNVISCGSYTGTGSVPNNITLGFEPQWLLVKSATYAGQEWGMFDSMRGLVTGSGGDAYLYANSSGAEGSGTYLAATATGFSCEDASARYNNSGDTYIYIAIRRGPMKVPTSGTSVFSPVAQTNSGSQPFPVTAGFPVDSAWFGQRNGWGVNFITSDRLRGATNLLLTTSTNSEATNNSTYGPSTSRLDSNTQFKDGMTNASEPDIYWMFKRAPGFFDEVCYTGTGSARTVTHNLGVAPELMIVKSRSNPYVNWFTYVSALGATKYLILDSTNSESTFSAAWNNTTPTSSVFTVGGAGATNGSGETFVAYLFATCAGVSKVGSYTGTGALQTINCGFTGGARFVLIKITNTSGNWFVWDTARGMVVGTDPSLALNSTAAEEPGDSVYTATGGFQLAASPTYPVNSNGYNYIYLAIA